MRLSAPTQLLFVVSLILAILGVVGTFVVIPVATQYAFWLVVAGYAVLAFGCLFRGA